MLFCRVVPHWVVRPISHRMSSFFVVFKMRDGRCFFREFLDRRVRVASRKRVCRP